MDIDLDLCPSKRPLIIQKIKEERGQNFNDEIDDLSRKNLGCTLIATFGTETTRAAITAACRGYRNADFPNGIDVDIAQYMSSLAPQERGFVWPLHDIVYGNPDKDRKPIIAFVKEVEQYPGLLDIMMGIEGLISRRGSHASGVILFDEDPYEYSCFMRTPKGEVITQYDLHMAEWCGNTKYDFLVTDACDKIVQCIQLLQEHKEIDPNLSLKEVYDKYLHPAVLPIEDKDIWKNLWDNSILNVFQFDSSVGALAAKKIKPATILEMANCNGLMRLMPSEKNQESPLDKYVRFKNDISLWYKEMEENGLTKQEQKTLEPYFLSSYGVLISQEQLMRTLMDKDICDFTLTEANEARQIVGKKQMSKIPELKATVLAKAKSKKLGEYVWKYGAGPQMGYSFSIIHALVYSFIGFQTMYLATHWNPIYWNTACLIVNSGSLDEDSGTNYTKTAKALNDIISRGIKVSLVNINKSSLGFEPDVENNQILFGLKGLTNINNDFVETIIKNRPYQSWLDFYNKIHPNRQAMISLIKGGAFDQFESRQRTMVEYIWTVCDKKKRLTLQNVPMLIRYKLLPEELSLSRRVFEFNKYLKNECKNAADINTFILDNRAIDFLSEINQENLIKDSFLLNKKEWDKVYQSYMDELREWIAANKEELLKQLNMTIFMEDWNKYGKGSISAWEMDVLCFYHSPHELINVNMDKYGLVNFFSLSEQPVVEKVFYKKNISIPIYRLFKICGTCIAKDKIKSTVYILTTTGVVPVKFRQEYFALFDKQIFRYNPDGTKKVIERSWFNRGNMIMVQGIRREDEFVTKKYAATGGHQLYHIDKVNDNGTIELRSTRLEGNEEDDNET